MLAAPSLVTLVCKNGHSSDHALGRILRLNDAWCPKCGADIPYTPDDAVPSAAVPAKKRATYPRRVAG